MVRGGFYQSFYVTAAHELCDPERLVPFLAQIEDRDDVRMGAQPAHGLSFPLDAFTGGVVQARGLDQSKSYFPVQSSVLGEVDFFLSTFSQKALDLVAAIGEGSGLVVHACR